MFAQQLIVKRMAVNNKPPSLPEVSRGEKIYVGGIPSACSESHLFEYFSRFGRLRGIIIPGYKNEKRRGSKTHRGFAYVSFYSADTAGLVLEQKHTLMGMRVLLPADSSTRLLQEGHEETRHLIIGIAAVCVEPLYSSKPINIEIRKSLSC